MGFLLKLYRYLRGNNTNPTCCDHDMYYNEHESINYYTKVGNMNVYMESKNLLRCQICDQKYWVDDKWITLPNHGRDVYI